MEVCNEEMVPFYRLSVHERAAIVVAKVEGRLEYYHGLDQEWIAQAFQ